ncbi:MAG: hypothetical protein RSE21_00560 [Bacilli bacterium]
MKEKIIETFKELTDSKITCPLSATLKSINASNLKLVGQTFNAFLGLSEEYILIAFFSKQNMKEPIYKTKLSFSNIKEVLIKETSLTKLKVIDMYGINNEYFKFTLSGSNEEKEIDEFINTLINIKN